MKDQKRSQSRSKNIDSTNRKINLKEIILNEIVNNNIWSDDDLSALFDRIKEEYSYIPEESLDEAISFVKTSIF